MGLSGIRIDSPSQPYILEAPDGPYLQIFAPDFQKLHREFLEKDRA